MLPIQAVDRHVDGDVENSEELPFSITFRKQSTNHSLKQGVSTDGTEHHSPDEHDEGLHILGLLLEYLHGKEADDVENSETSLSEPTFKMR